MPSSSAARASGRTGLTAAEAEARLRAEGPNALPSASGRPLLRIMIDVMREPMLALLLGGGAVYLLIGSATEAIVLLCFAGFSVFVTIVQESRTERVLRSLRDLAAPRALVVRDGDVVRIAGRDVVRGDLLVLENGDRVAADAVVLEASDLSADESLLTGEAVPVSKRPLRPGEEFSQTPAGGDDLPLIFSGTMITRGHAVAKVVAIGSASQIGRIGQSLAGLQIEAPGLRRQIRRIVELSAAGAAIATTGVVLLYGLARGSWLDALLAGIAIGMALLPEEFPVVLTVFLAVGAWRISKAGVLTRRAAAIEALGAATILCTDKTGTLTCNRMTVRELWRPDTGGMPLRGDIAIDGAAPLLATGALASAAYPTDPMETALHAAASVQGATRPGNWTLHRSFALAPDLLAMSNVWRRPGEDELTIAAKGAPEAIGQLCRLALGDRDAMEAAARDMAARGMRVLGIAEAHAGVDALGPRQEDHAFTLVGLVGLADPLRDDVPAAIARCHAAGIRVMMITGDHVETARAIATDAGIASGDVLSGPEIVALDDATLARRLRTTSVCARVMPAEKLRIVTALKAAGEVVAMTGDGVNDAPALKAAHIGIAMGRRGTDVAREAAAIVLVDDDFAAIVAAIALGRRIYDNLRKAMGFIFAVHVPIAGLALLPLLTGLPVIFGPIQIALVELIVDPVCALFFEAEPEERGAMERPPRPAAEPLFSLPMIVRSVAQGAVAFVLLGAILIGGAWWELSPETLRTLVFFALVAAIVALVLVNRAFSRSLGEALWRGNAVLRYILAGIAAGSAIVIGIAPVRAVLQFAPLEPAQLLVIALIGVTLLVGLERIKLGGPRNAA